MNDIRIFEPLWPNWVIDDKIGSGSFGSVWRAHRDDSITNMTQYAAVKHIAIPNETAMEDMEGMRSSSRNTIFKAQLDELTGEIKTMISLRGKPYIVNYEEHRIVAREDGCGYDLFVRMELLTTIQSYLKTHGFFTQRDVVRMGIQIASALEVLQNRKLIHRDIKPGNILMDEDGDFKLGDFGTARVLEGGSAASTHTGTPSYMAPEVYTYSGRYDQTVDIYSLGIMLYRYLNANYLPFTDEQHLNAQEALLHRIHGDNLPPPSGADERLTEIVMKCVAFKPANRWQTAAELRRALERYEASMPESAGNNPASVSPTAVSMSS